ncbi:unnamed protein product [Miscanthus lutarioriparius]|uniref:DUF6857 domain-containing protein n=1 Tax=Miscanthus lutarioriparius TaxID=422564 RepID=A0A811QA32_9POAL|nr:unnamed protein product [Miscanthus lutarioriparius]
MASSASARSPNANEAETAVKRTAVGPKNPIAVVADPAPSAVSASLKKQANKRNNIRVANCQWECLISASLCQQQLTPSKKFVVFPQQKCRCARTSETACQRRSRKLTPTYWKQRRKQIGKEMPTLLYFHHAHASMRPRRNGTRQVECKRRGGGALISQASLGERHPDPPASFYPTRFAGKSAPRLVRGIRTPGATSSSVKAAAASRASRSAVKTATPAIRGTPRTVTSKHLKELAEGRDATATIAASVLQEASIFDSLLRNESEFSDICDSAKVSDPLPTVDPFLGVYKDTLRWKDVAESVASVELSATKYWIGGGTHVVHELSLPNAPKTKSTAKERTAELAKDLCGQMQRWFLDFVEALDVENKWKHSSDTPTLLSQFEKISDWLEQVQHQIVVIKRLKHRR